MSAHKLLLPHNPTVKRQFTKSIFKKMRVEKTFKSNKVWKFLYHIEPMGDIRFVTRPWFLSFHLIVLRNVVRTTMDSDYLPCLYIHLLMSRQTRPNMILIYVSWYPLFNTVYLIQIKKLFKKPYCKSIPLHLLLFPYLAFLLSN